MQNFAKELAFSDFRPNNYYNPSRFSPAKQFSVPQVENKVKSTLDVADIELMN